MTQTNNPHALETEPIGKLIFQYSLPAIIAMAVTSLYNIIDSVFIGHGVGGAAVSSIFLGQKNDRNATEVLHNVFILEQQDGGSRNSGDDRPCREK